MEVHIGQIWQAGGSSVKMMVVGFDGNLVCVKGANQAKKNLAHARGAHVISRTDMQDWTLIEDAPALREP